MKPVSRGRDALRGRSSEGERQVCNLYVKGSSPFDSIPIGESLCG